MRARISAATALTLILGFAVASATGNRPLGGAVLIAGGVLCAWWTYQLSGLGRTLTLLGIALTLFVISHPLGHVIGAWPSVFLVAGVGAALAYALTRPRSDS
jgi:uncharacterized membrane protein